MSDVFAYHFHPPLHLGATNVCDLLPTWIRMRYMFCRQGGEWDLEIYDDDWSAWVLLNEEDAITGVRPRIRTVMRGDLVVLER